MNSIERPQIVAYHNHCSDGFCAAWVCWLAWGNDVEFVAIDHGTDWDLGRFEGKDVLFVDLCPKAQDLITLIGIATRVRVWDHHKTAKPWIEAAESVVAAGAGYGVFEAVFRLDRSGAGIAFDMLRDLIFKAPRDIGPVVERLVNYVQDRDLWTWKLVDSKEISEMISMLEPVFYVWTSFATELELDQELVVSKGALLLAYKDRWINQIIENGASKIIEGEHGTKVEVNAPIFQSEIGNRIVESMAGVSYADIYYTRGDGQVVHSLRSKGDFDVSAIAASKGGAGHKNAAGYAES